MKKLIQNIQPKGSIILTDQQKQEALNRKVNKFVAEVKILCDKHGLLFKPVIIYTEDCIRTELRIVPNVPPNAPVLQR